MALDTAANYMGNWPWAIFPALFIQFLSRFFFFFLFFFFFFFLYTCGRYWHKSWWSHWNVFSSFPSSIAQPLYILFLLLLSALNLHSVLLVSSPLSCPPYMMAIKLEHQLRKGGERSRKKKWTFTFTFSQPLVHIPRPFYTFYLSNTTFLIHRCAYPSYFFSSSCW